MTREEEIEALAMQMMAEGFRPYRADGSTMCEETQDEAYENCMDRALMVVDTRDRYRAARHPAPEAEQPTPTPRIDVLKRWLECCMELNCDAIAFLSGQGDRQIYSGRWYSVCVDGDELTMLRAHAATLKKQQRGEVRDGA
jgi:hypothetical protein